MKTKTPNILHAAMIKLMRPLVRILLRNGIPFQQFSDLVKWVYVDVAAKEFGIAGRKQTDSRVAIITGLSRKVVRQMRALNPPSDETTVQNYNRAARVIAGWRNDPDFAESDGAPRALPFEGRGYTFSLLVHRYSGDVPPRSVLDEMERVGAVRVADDRRVHLTADAYVPGGDEAAMLSILGADVSDLVNTIDHNMAAPGNHRFFQRKVAYDNLPTVAVEKFKKFGREESQQLLERMDRWLSEHDRDVHPSIRGEGRKRSGIGIYYFEEDLNAQQSGAKEGE